MPMFYSGETIADRYRVERELGAGGFGDVYEAIELGIERRVAIKVLRPDDGRGYKALTKARFVREAKAVGSLQSPHTVQLLDFGEADGKLYMVFELVPGEDLRTIINRETRLEPKRAVHVLTQLLDSLGEAHHAGILHRDIKPANIRVFPWGDNPMFVKLLDFGLARPTDEGSPGITETGELLGTPRYMSPEQLRAQPLTPASDIYSLGIVFLEMLIGAAPLQGNRWSDQFDRMMTGHLFSFPELEQIGPELVALMQRMTAHDSSQRPQSTDAVLGALKPEPTTVPRMEATSSQKGGWTLAVAVVGLLAVVAGIVLTYPKPAPEPPNTTRPDNPLSAPTGPRKATKNRIGSGKLIESTQADLRRSIDVANAIASGGSEGCRTNSNLDDLVGENLEQYDFLGHVPPTYVPTRPLPLVLFLPRDEERNTNVASRLGQLPGADEDFAEAQVLAEGRHRFLMSTSLPSLAATKGFMVLIPSIRKSWKWKTSAPRVAAEIKRFADVACIDRARVFVVGDFKGSMLAFQLANEPWVTAVGAFSFGTIPKHAPAIFPSRPKPLLLINPTQSAHVPLRGRNECIDEDVVSINAVEAHIRSINGCSSSSRRLDASCKTWTCDTPFVACRLEGGHRWPDALPIDDGKDCQEGPDITGYDLGAKFWDFFESTSPLPVAIAGDVSAPRAASAP